MNSAPAGSAHHSAAAAADADAADDSVDSRITVTLSRPAYRLGGTVVGTVRWRKRKKRPRRRQQQQGGVAAGVDNDAVDTNDDDDNDADDELQSLTLIVAGRCRLDPRWYNVTEYQKIYGRRHPSLHDLPSVSGAVGNNSNNNNNDNTICFWATDRVELLPLQERTTGRWWEDCRPQPIILRTAAISTTTSNNTNEQEEEDRKLPANDTAAPRPVPGVAVSSGAQPQQKNTTKHQQQQQQQRHKLHRRQLEREQLAYTFRVDLPTDLPHSVAVTPCRYYYTVLVRVHRKPKWSLRPGPNNKNRRQQYRRPIWIQVPFTVLTETSTMTTTTNSRVMRSPRAQDDHGVTVGKGTRVQIGSCDAVAHSAGLPSEAVPATELHQISGQLTVHHHGASHYRHIRPAYSQQQHQNAIQTMRVSDTQGRPVAILTVMGAAVMCPGSRLLLKFSFPIHDQPPRHHNNNNDSDDADDAWVPCYQVCACLQGEEVAIHPNGARTRARYHVFGTAHSEVLDPAYTEQVCLDLTLPTTAPCSLQTDVVDVAISCLIDITVGDRNAPNKYSNLRLTVPCHVIDAAVGVE